MKKTEILFGKILFLLLVGICSGNLPAAELTPQTEWDYAKARHLMVRAGFGGTPQEIEKLQKLGLQKAVDYLVDFKKLPEAGNAIDVKNDKDRAIEILTKLSKESGNDSYLEVIKNPRELRKLGEIERKKFSRQMRRMDSRQMAQIQEYWLSRLVKSPRPLEEKLVLFWHGHFASEYRTVRSSYAMFQQNELFRKEAAGNFGVMLHAIIHDPAMLRYLDNNKNIKARPNENLAREIMELFSMGVGNYTEKDIKEAARALTGNGYNRQTQQYVFNKRAHDDGEKTIFGKTANYDGDSYVDLILEQPATARFIARKLFLFFAHDDPSEQTIDQLANVLKSNNYEVAPMLKVLFRSEEFYSKKTMGTQIKSPVQIAVGTFRDLGVTNIQCRVLSRGLKEMGQELFSPPNVKGWEGGRNWINSNRIFIRYNQMADLVDKIPSTDKQKGLDMVKVLEDQNFKTSEEVIDYLTKSCLVVNLDQEKRELLIKSAESLPPSSRWKKQRKQVNKQLRSLMILLTSLPEFQLT